ncbi:MAG TPA: nitroreductase/quinone reductase family protein [Acidimicrobiales bacterium]|jgi:deazaflavin-dependent oxidoreductase (nitroreductase family)|nr:nitroreductase/quinone reductase family protein [Acidimicrobiales bacterium]
MTYQEPGWFTRNVFNRAVAGLTRAGISVVGSRVLETRGRTTGEPRRTPVNLLTLDGRDYLVAARGETQWVRNVRADAGRLTLIKGRRRQPRIGQQLNADEAIPVLRAYLKRWKFEVGVFFDGVSADSTDDELRQAATQHPVFALSDTSKM